MTTEPPRSEFEESAQQHRKDGVLREFWDFLRYNKKWWLIPIIIVMLALGLLMYLSATGAAPFIYTLF
jgi:hypothetical protein